MRFKRGATAVVTASVLMLSGLQPASAATSDVPVTYRDMSYGTSVTTSPTGDKPQSKLWFQDGAWWALMLNESDNMIHIAELRSDHTWRMTSTVVDDRASATSDALWDGSRLYVATRQAASALKVSRLSYDAATRSYSVDAGFPSVVTSGGSESAVLDKDSTGRLWVTYTRGKSVWVAHTTTNDLTWTAPFVPPVPATTVSSDDISSLLSFDGKIGVMWSNQATDEFRFAVHMDGAPDSAWTVETPLAGTLLADDHINLKNIASDSQGRVYAVVKTSLDDAVGAQPTDPQVLVLVRERDGSWTSVVAGTVADDHSRPMLLLDETNRTLYFFATAPVSNGVIYYKKSPLDNVSLGPGRGDPFVKYTGKYVNNATSTKQPVNATTGIVVLAASGSTDHFYYHAEMGIAARPDVTAPSAPTALTVVASTSSVALSWSASTDNVAVAGYRVFRDNVQVAQVASTSFTDATVQPGQSYSYAVSAFDAAGNLSSSSAGVTVATPRSADATAPSVPTELATVVSGSSVLLSWAASSDDTGVVGYRVRRDGVQVAEVASTSFTDATVQPGQNYSYTVSAFDAAGNASAPSAAVGASTPSAPTPIVFQSASAGANSTDVRVTVNSPAGVLAGDVFVASVDVRGRPTITAPTGWRLLRTDDNATTMRKATYVKVATTTEPASYTWALSSSQGAAATIQAYGNVDVSNPVELSAGQVNAASTSLNAPAVTAGAGDLVLALFGAANLVAVTPPAGYLERAEAGTPAGTYKVTSESADVLATSAGDTGALTARSSLSSQSIGHTVVLRPAR
jgi:chitodextrinase